MKFPTAPRRVAAFTLVEVALAMGVASFCLVAVLGLVPLGVSTGQVASDQTAASDILTHVLADLRATPVTSLTSAEYSITIPAAGTTPPATTLYFGSSAQQFSVSATPGVSRYRLTVTFLPRPGGGRTATGATLLVSWPPQINPVTGTPTGRVQMYAGLNRN